MTKAIKEGCIDKHKRTMFHMAAIARLLTIGESGYKVTQKSNHNICFEPHEHVFDLLWCKHSPFDQPDGALDPRLSDGEIGGDDSGGGSRAGSGSGVGG